MSKIHNPLVGLETRVVSSTDATIVIVSGVIDDERFEWEGTAKRDPGDRYNSEVGNKLALSRALSAAASQLARQANGLTKNIEDNRIQSEAAKKRGVPKAFRVVRKTTPPRRSVASTR